MGFKSGDGAATPAVDVVNFCKLWKDETDERIHYHP